MKKKKGFSIQINFTNRWLYAFITIGILMIVGVGVYAWANPITGVGHDLNEIEPCADGQILQMSGGTWSCVYEDVSLWAQSGSDISYTNGKVGIGTTSLTHELNVVGDTKITGDLTVEGWLNFNTVNLKVAKINIGVWNMNTVDSIDVDISPIEINRILMAQVFINNDAIEVGDQDRYTLEAGGTIRLKNSGYVLTLLRDSGGVFDNTDYDRTDISSRGRLFIIYTT